MDLSSFVTSLATSFIIFAILLLVFSWLSKRPGNEVIYYPSRVLKGLEPFEQGMKSRNPFSWIMEAIRASEDEVISMAGVDAATYLVFLSTGCLLAPLVFSFLSFLSVFRCLMKCLFWCFSCRDTNFVRNNSCAGSHSNCSNRR